MATNQRGEWLGERFTGEGRAVAPLGDFQQRGWLLRRSAVDEKQVEERRSVMRLRFGEKVARFEKGDEGGSDVIFMAGGRGKRRGGGGLVRWHHVE
jgi:hypothetical protein